MRKGIQLGGSRLTGAVSWAWSQLRRKTRLINPSITPVTPSTITSIPYPFITQLTAENAPVSHPPSAARSTWPWPPRKRRRRLSTTYPRTQEIDILFRCCSWRKHYILCLVHGEEWRGCITGISPFSLTLRFVLFFYVLLCGMYSGSLLRVGAETSMGWSRWS